MKMSFVLNCGLYSKTGKWVLSRKRDNVSNSGYVQKWKTWHIVLKTVKRFNIKRTHIIIFILKNSNFSNTISGDISSKTNTWPISNSVRNEPNLQSSFSRVYIFKSKPSRTKLRHLFIKNGQTFILKKELSI